MKLPLSLFLLASAAGALTWIAMRAPERAYVAPKLEEVRAHVPAPTVLRAEVPAGSTVRTLDVEGMCCTGCTGKLYARLKAEPGVLDAAVDFQQGIARAIVPAESDPRVLEALLTFDQYTAKLRP